VYQHGNHVLERIPTATHRSAIEGKYSSSNAKVQSCIPDGVYQIPHTVQNRYLDQNELSGTHLSWTVAVLKQVPLNSSTNSTAVSTSSIRARSTPGPTISVSG
jgi:hypothetical protein